MNKIKSVEERNSKKRQNEGQISENIESKKLHEAVKKSPPYTLLGVLLTLHGLVLHWCDVLKAWRRDIPVLFDFLLLLPRWGATEFRDKI